MEKVTYILGAGFSAPLGLPVMSNFLFKSKDMFYEKPDTYVHFKKVFDSIEKLSISKNYYNSDLFNIEEILSLTEMIDFVDGKKLSKAFTQYIIDVISFYTPELKPYEGGSLPGNWQDFVFGNRATANKYAYFAGNLLRLCFSQRQKAKSLPGSDAREFIASINKTDSTRYAVLTLNYDLVLENVATFVNKHYVVEDTISFQKTDYDPDWESCHLAKLHGCVDGGIIVPPTWAKGTHPQVVPSWKAAYQVLRDSNHIRFIGYSLPVSDSYLKYLLKSAVVDCKHLKSLDVICLDPDGSVRSRFDEFLEFNYYRFKEASISDYIDNLIKTTHDIRRNNYDHNSPITMNSLEKVHASFMSQNEL